MPKFRLSPDQRLALALAALQSIDQSSPDDHMVECTWCDNAGHVSPKTSTGHEERCPIHIARTALAAINVSV